MNIDLILVGKTTVPFVAEAMEVYAKRLGNYVNFSTVVIPDVKNAKSLSEGQLKEAEGEAILKTAAKYDRVVLLDEKGTELSSEELAGWIEKKAAAGTRRLALVVGGAYGFAPKVYEAAAERLSLSRMTFSHQMIRMLIAEQLYRAFTILKGEPYHHK